MQSSIRWRLALSFATIALLAALLLGAILLALLLRSYSDASGRTWKATRLPSAAR